MPAVLFADHATSTNTALSSTTVTCIQSALDKRENAIISSQDVFNTSIKNALSARLSALKASYTEVTKQSRKQKREDAYKQFRSSAQTAHNTLRSSKNAAWNTFSTDMKACGVRHDERPQTVAIPAISL